MTAQDHELSAALGWPGGISDPVLDRTLLLQMVVALRLASQQALEALKALDVLFSPCVKDSTQADWIDKARAAIAANKKWAQGTNGCVAFKHGAEWFRLQMLPIHKCPQQDEPVEPVDVGLLEYQGNSVAFIHQKMTAYRTGIDAAWDAFRANGLHPDGKTPLADMIAKHTAPPQRTMVPLTEEEIFKIENDIPDDVISDRAWTICLTRAVEKASWEKNHG